MRYEIKVPLENIYENKIYNWMINLKFLKKEFPMRKISSIYFDTDDYDIAMDNLTGTSVRCKYRIRWYNDLDEIYNYEIKIKKNSLGKKVILKSKKNNINISDCFNYKNLIFKKKENEFFFKYINTLNLKPVLKITYFRSYFVYNKKIRITYDSNLSYEKISRYREKFRKINDNYNVIEIKFGPENISLGKNLLQTSPFIPKRFSKYLRGLHLYGNAIYI
jgi:SPX domain protein involved in polyphosphate accumulation